jgi:hypothetical protein
MQPQDQNRDSKKKKMQQARTAQYASNRIILRAARLQRHLVIAVALTRKLILFWVGSRNQGHLE